MNLLTSQEAKTEFMELMLSGVCGQGHHTHRNSKNETSGCVDEVLTSIYRTLSGTSLEESENIIQNININTRFKIYDSLMHNKPF